MTRSTLPRLAVIALALLAGAAQARPVHYQCTGYLGLDAELTPRDGQVHFQGHDWRVQRVRAAGQARYVGRSKAAGSIDLAMRQSALTLKVGDQSYDCKLVTDALKTYQAASAPTNGVAPAPAAAASR